MGLPLSQIRQSAAADGGLHLSSLCFVVVYNHPCANVVTGKHTLPALGGSASGGNDSRTTNHERLLSAKHLIYRSHPSMLIRTFTFKDRKEFLLQFLSNRTSFSAPDRYVVNRANNRNFSCCSCEKQFISNIYCFPGDYLLFNFIPFLPSKNNNGMPRDPGQYR